MLVTVVCTYFFTSENKVKLVASGFNTAIQKNQFFTLRVPGYLSPRSTAPTGSFEFASYNDQGVLLDFQKVGIVAQAKAYHEIKTAVFEATSQKVGDQNSFLKVTFRTLDPLLETDLIQVVIPKWNQQSSFPSPMISYDPDALQCSGVPNKNTNDQILCSIERGITSDSVKLFRPLNKTLALVTDAQSNDTKLDDGVIEVGSEISFIVGPISNPISTAPISGFQLRTLSYNLGNIALGFGSLQVTQLAEIKSDSNSVSLAVTETLINKNSNFLIEVELPVPLNAGCQIDLYIPKPLVIGSDLTEVIIGGLFGTIRQASFTLDADKNLISIDGACRTYRQNAAKATFEINSLRNPGYVMTSESFQIEFSDVNDNEIVKTSGGLVYTTTPGTMKVQQWFASNKLVSAQSDITFSIQPLNPSQNADVQVKLYFPVQDFELLPNPCRIVFSNQLVKKDGWVCKTDAASQVITLSNFLREKYTLGEFSFIEFGISQIQMPSSSRPTGSFKIEFWDNIQGKYYLVDTVAVSDKIRALPGGLSQVNVSPLYGTTYTLDTMTFRFKLGHKLIKNGYITINIPSELKFQGSPNCISFSQGISEKAYCQINIETGELILLNGFVDRPYDNLDFPLSIKVEGIFTMRSVRPTSTFAFKTFDENGYAIDTSSTYFLPSLVNAKELEQLSVIQSEKVVGKSSMYSFLIQSPYPLYSGDILTLTVPDQAAKTLAQSYREGQCKGIQEYNFLVTDLQCTLFVVNSIRITLKLASGLTEIPVNAQFGFSLAFLENPESTRPSDPFKIRITDFRENLVVVSTEKKHFLQGFVMQATQAAQLIKATVENKPKYAKEPTLIQLTFTITHTLPTNAQIQIKVPKQLGLPEKANELSCWVDTSPFGDLPCTFDASSFLFTLTGVNPYGSLRTGSEIKVELKGLKNRQIAEVTNSFEIRTLTKDSFFIDDWTDGLTVNSNCDWPCWECPVGKPTQCLKCDTRPGAELPLYFNGSCRNNCPSNYFVMNQICSKCDAGCLECDKVSKKCLECHFGMYLLGNQCLSVCPNTHHGIDKTKTCELCGAPCKTCEGSLTRCTSCDQTQAQSLFFRNQCFETCPLDISVFNEGVCEECNPNCKTCDSQYSANFCTTCYDGNYLDFFTNKCVQRCTAGLTVASKKPGAKQELTCELCNVNCLTCDEKNTQICLECRDGLKMIETKKQCVTECPSKTAEVWIPLTKDTICVECAPGCAECKNSRDHCTICEDGFVFFEFNCVKQCPTGYTLISKDVRTCVRDGEVCPYGQRYNSFGQCELYLAHCRVGYVLNSKQTECIPEPGFHLPFAFLYASIGWGLFILRKKNRTEMSRENLVAQLLIGLTTLQQLSYFVQLILAYTIDYTLVSGLHTFALLFNFFLNAVCLLYIHLMIKDKPFQHWRDQYTRENRIIIAISTAYSFKNTRMLYSNFLRKPYFDAPCENKFRSIIRPLFIVTMCSLLQMGSIFLANVYTIWLLRWGYEIVTLAIESIVMALLIFSLEIYEFVLYRRQEPEYLSVGAYFAKQDPNIARTYNQGASGSKQKAQVRVMSIMENGVADDGDFSSFISVGGANQSQKILLGTGKDGGPSLRSDQKQYREGDEGETAFEFTNFQMGKKIQIDKERIDFGHQGQAPILQAMIKKLKEHTRIKKAQKDIEAEKAKHTAVFDGTDLPEVNEDEQNGLVVVDQYLDEAIRKKLLISSTKDKNKQFRAMRQQFEQHRRDEKEFANENYRTCVNDLENKLKPDPSQVNPIRNDFKPLKSMITTVKLPPTQTDHVGCIEQLLDCSDGELERDKVLYDEFYVKYKKQFDEKARAGLLVPNARLHQSFDEDVLREMYDDFGVASDFESELSWISYPPKKGFLAEYYENNPVKQAENELFKQKIKVKFQFNNLYKENFDMPPRPKLNIKPSRKTQTDAADIQTADILSEPDTKDILSSSFKNNIVNVKVNLDFDPFESEEESLYEESDQLSAIDQEICGGLVHMVLTKGFSDTDFSEQTPRTRKRSDSRLGIRQNSRIGTHQNLLDETESNQRDGPITKKRKREDIEQDFKNRQLHAKTKSKSNRVGLNGRATDPNANRTFENKLGDVYDTNGHLVYDKDYISQQDDEIPSAKDFKSPSRQNSGAKTKSFVASSQQSLKQRGNNSKVSQNVGSKDQVNSESILPSKQTDLNTIDKALVSEKGESQSKHQKPEITTDKQIPPGQNLSDFNFLDEFQEDEEHHRNKMSKRERQMIFAYTSGGSSALETDNQQTQPQLSRKQHKSKTSAHVSRKRKRNKTPQGLHNNVSNRGLTDAQEQIDQERVQDDNGILQVVISSKEQSSEGKENSEVQAFTTTAMMLKTDKKPDPNSEFEIDQETRGGNLSSSAHDHSSGANLHVGLGTASGMNRSRAGYDGSMNLGRPVSGLQAHQFFNNTQWESDAASAGQYQLNPNIQQLTKWGGALDTPDKDGELRTDSEEHVRRLQLNNTEFTKRVEATGVGVRDFPIVDNIHQQVANWSDNGLEYRGGDNLAKSVQSQEDTSFARLGQSYPYNRKMTGPQPFQILGVTTKPFKARKKRKDEQLLADQRRAKFSMSSNRMHKLENIYIKHGIGNSTNKQLPPRGTSVPRADSLTAETMAVFQRHQPKRQSEIPSGLAQRLTQNFSLNTTNENRRIQGPRLHKQNFIEDGQNIISGQAYSQGINRNATAGGLSSQNIPRVKAQLSNSASQNADFHVLHKIHQTINQENNILDDYTVNQEGKSNH